MALTQDQSEMLQTAVNNLNESVAVNKEVLEIVKSVGNTGAVDIAQHNNSTESHENGFNRLVVQSNFYIGGQSTTTEPGAISALRVVRDSGRAIGNVALGALLVLGTRVFPLRIFTVRSTTIQSSRR